MKWNTALLSDGMAACFHGRGPALSVLRMRSITCEEGDIPLERYKGKDG